MERGTNLTDTTYLEHSPPPPPPPKKKNYRNKLTHYVESKILITKWKDPRAEKKKKEKETREIKEQSVIVQQLRWVTRLRSIKIFSLLIISLWDICNNIQVGVKFLPFGN